MCPWQACLARWCNAVLTSALMRWRINEKNDAATEQQAELQHGMAAVATLNTLVEKRSADLETVRAGMDEEQRHTVAGGYGDAMLLDELVMRGTASMAVCMW